MTWQRKKVSYLEANFILGAAVVVGWEIVRHCGCLGKTGMRMDRREVTFGVVPCDRHGGEVRRALETLQHMPPSATEIEELFKQQLEAEIGTGV